VIPLWPYAVLPLMWTALVVSLGCTLVALFALGIVKSTVARQRRGRGGLQVLAIGSVSAGIGFAIGHIVTAIVG
jgi:VIT1/CCC1 family predicted Fe2+/Mn2+ transporter